MTHRNAVLTPQGRYRLVMRVQAGRPIAHVAAEAGIARATGVEVARSLPPRRNPGSRGPLQRPSPPSHPDQCQDGGPHRALAPHPQVVRPSYRPRARRARDSGVGTHRDPLAGQSRSEPTARHRSHRAVQPGRQTHPGPFPGPHDPPGRQEGRTHPTRKEAGGPTGEEPPGPQPPNEAKEPGSATPTCTPPSTASPAWPTPRPSTTRRPPP